MKRNIPLQILSIGILVLAVFGFVAIRSQFNDPENVFYDMLERNLSTQGVTRTTTESVQTQSLTRVAQAQTGAQNVVSGEIELNQGEGENSSTVITENLATPEKDYLRYAEIETNQTNASGQELDFSDALGVWSVTEPNSSQARLGEAFGEAVLGVVPSGALSSQQSNELIDFIRNNDVYGVDFAQTTKRTDNGRPVYTYEAAVQPGRYVQMLKLFADYINTDQLNNLDPNNFVGQPTISLRFEVDVWSRQLKQVEFVGTNRVETFSGYGLTREVLIPQNTISTSELQTRLRNVQ